AAPFDLTSLSATGPGVPVMQDVSSTQLAGANFRVSPNGTLIFVAGKDPFTRGKLYSVDAAGAKKPIHEELGRYESPHVSPDGKRLVYVQSNGKTNDLWVKDLERDTASRLTFLPGSCSYPAWTPDGKSIFFRYYGTDKTGIYRIR